MSFPSIEFYAQPYVMHDVINAFFLYSFFGWVMECIVIRHDTGVWENRGFVRLPFCIIYGFGSLLGYIFLRPFSSNYVVLYFVGAVLATLFEYLTARIMLRLFGSFWWDYSNKKYNYHGILCLESSAGWGVISVLLFAVFQDKVFWLVQSIPTQLGTMVAFLLTVMYVVDFALSMRRALRQKALREEESYQSLLD